MPHNDCVQPNDSMFEGFERVDLHSDGDFAQAYAAAWREAENRRKAPMLIAWWNEEEQAYSPGIDCKGYEDPAWLKYAKAYGSDLSVHVDGNRYIFLFRSAEAMEYGHEDARILGDHMRGARNQDTEGLT